MKLVLVRHGETSWILEGRFQGHSDVSLNERGLAQAQAVATALKSLEPDALYSSPILRTAQMAKIISAHLSLEISLMDNLKELDLGEIEGITGLKMKSDYPDIYHEWGKDPSLVVMPGGESLHQLQKRTWRGIQQIESNHPQEVVVAVSHNFAIVSVLCKLLQIPLSRFHQLWVGLGSITTLESGEQGWRLISYNERCHLNSPNSRDH